MHISYQEALNSCYFLLTGVKHHNAMCGLGQFDIFVGKKDNKNPEKYLHIISDNDLNLYIGRIYKTH